MASTAETAVSMPKKFHLELDLAMKASIQDGNHEGLLETSTNDAGEKTTVPERGMAILDLNTPANSLPADLTRKLQHNFLLTKRGLILSLESKGISVLDNDKLLSHKRMEYVDRMKERNGPAVVNLAEDESVLDRFWQIHEAPTTQICPPPASVMPEDANGSPNAYDFDYRYTGITLRSPAMDCWTLDQRNNEYFLQEIHGNAEEWRGRGEDGKCTWKEVQYVLHVLNEWRKYEAERLFTVIPMDEDVNTTLRILLKCGRKNTSQTHGDMTVDQMKKLALFMWFYERHLRFLCHPQQSIRRQQSTLFPYWGSHGPLSRSLEKSSLAAVEPVEKHQVPNVLAGYFSGPSFPEVKNLNALTNIWLAPDAAELIRQLQLPETKLLGLEACYNRVQWPVLGFYHGRGLSKNGERFTDCVTAISGFQCGPFDVHLYRSVATLALGCFNTSILPPTFFRILLAGAMQTSRGSTLQLVRHLGTPTIVWKYYLCLYRKVEDVPEDAEGRAN